MPFALGACGALEKLGTGGSPNDGAAPSEGGVPRSADSGGGEAGGVMPNDGIGSGAGDRYESENGVRGRSAAGVVSIGRGISGARKGIGDAEKGDGPFDPAAGDIRWKSCVNSPGCAGSLYATGGAIGFGGALSSVGCGSGANGCGDIDGGDIDDGGATGSVHALGTLAAGSDVSFRRPKIAVKPLSMGAGAGFGDGAGGAAGSDPR